MMARQPTLFGGAPAESFDGETFAPHRDGARLTGQLDRVRLVMADARWRTLRTIAKAVDGSEAGVSARLRDLRKPRFGGHTVERRYQAEGVWEYRLLVRVESGE